MTNFYRKIRGEMIAGGDTESVEQNPVDKSKARIGGAIMIGLLAYLGANNAWTLLFVVGLLLSVFLHEVGHFVTARRSGMKVTQFYMGFGPRLWSFTRNGVEYGIRAIPLGAFVRIIGMNNLDDSDPADEARTYRAQSYPKRMLVITAGSLMHMIIAFVLFVGVYSFSGRYSETGSVRIFDVPAAASPAARAGVLKDDVVVSFDGVAVSTRGELISAIVSHNPGDVVPVRISRDGTPLDFSVQLASNPANPSVAFFGISGWSQDYVAASPIASVGFAIGDVATTAVRSVRGVFTVLNPRNIVASVTSDVADPMTRPSTVVGASQVGGEIGRQDGLKGLLILLAGVNIFVGIFNMFPLLPFDGGHAAIATYERLRSRRGRVYRADVAKMVPVATAVILLLGALMITGVYLDITQPLG